MLLDPSDFLRATLLMLLQDEEPQTISTADLDEFANLKKKKKKKVFDMEEFEKSLDAAATEPTPVAAPAPPKAEEKKKAKVLKAKEEWDDEEEEDDEDDNEFDDIADIDEEELGENPFAEGAGGDSYAEPWIGSDRDYSYNEVRCIYTFQCYQACITDNTTIM